jgi:hypothetical protein
MTMNTKSIIALAALAAFASSTLVVTGAQANPQQFKIIKPLKPLPPKKPPHWHGHGHFKPVYIVERPIVRPVALLPALRGTCNCLTKEYTPEGTVVFKDLCTREIASAPVDGAPAQASEAERPQNFAGKTYQDYLNANPQAEKAEPQKN